jgi:hypothetical protein
MNRIILSASILFLLRAVPAAAADSVPPAGDATPVVEHSLISAYGIRSGALTTAGNMNSYFGSGESVLEAFVILHPRGKADYEISVGGYHGSSLEQGVVNLSNGGTSGYQYTQSLVVIPVLGTVEFGPVKKHGSLKFGAGAGLYYANLEKTLTFGDGPTQATFGSHAELNRVTAGPHVQVTGNYFFSNNIGIGFLMRWAYAPLNENLFRNFQSAAPPPGTAFFADSGKAGNIAGLLISAGLAFKL